MAVWNVHYSRGDWNCLADDYFSYSYFGDTVLGIYTYKKVYVITVNSSGDIWCAGMGPFGGGYKGAIRQDTATHKVFFVRPGQSYEAVLYDFNLNVGDTVPYDTTGDCMYPGYVTIVSIDSILIGNQYRKSYTTNFWFTIIEGIGSSQGLLEAGCNCNDGYSWWLTCFSQNGQTLFPDTITNCDIIDMVREQTITNPGSAIILSPNPFHTTTTMRISNPDFKNLAPVTIGIKIYDALGTLMRSEKTEFKNANEIKIDRGGLSDGLYFFQLTNKELSASGKFIIE